MTAMQVDGSTWGVASCLSSMPYRSPKGGVRHAARRQHLGLTG